ncbi:MAG: aspartate/alanine exchanger family protein [Devosia sp.]|jgi:aspartate-alanine antiporter|nr:aspartate/alanine exchanger family protein [Devosia sp.]
MQWIQDHLRQSPEILLFFSLAVGFWIGKIHFGKFQLGGVAGSLLVAVVVSLVGVQVDSGVRSILFALFIYAVGFESGPRFFRSLGRESIKEIVLAICLAATGLATVIVMARLFGLDKGMAAGVAAGGLTQSAIIGTAGDALSKMGLAADELQRQQADVAIGYAVTYIFGSLGAIIICVNVLPAFMGRGLRDDAMKAEAERLKGALSFGPGQELAVPGLVGRLFRIEQGSGKSISEIEKVEGNEQISIERLKRSDQLVDIRPDTILATGDIVLVVGRRAQMVNAAGTLGPELQSSSGMDLVMDTRDVVLKNPRYTGHSIGEIKRITTHELRHGVYVLAIKREGDAIPMDDSTVVEAGDVITLYGTDRDLKRAFNEIGEPLSLNIKTDFVYHGAGLVVGLLIGLLVLRIGSVPLTLGSGGGALLSGLLFGWYRSRNQTMGNMPPAASQLLKDLGLAGFVAAIGLQSGRQAIDTIATSGLSIFLIGVVVTVVPLLLTMAFGRYVLRYDNSAIFAGALSGSRSANPAFGEVLDKAGNSIPTVPFAITYALANVFLTLLGPLIVAFV